MGSTASSQRRKSGSNRRLQQPLDRDQPERRSLRSIGRTKSHTDGRILRTSSNQSLPAAANRPTTLYNASQAELSEVRQNLMTLSSAPAPDQQSPADPVVGQLKSRTGADSPPRSRRSATASPDTRVATLRLYTETANGGLNSPFSVITSQELLDTDEDYRSVNDFLSKHYSAPDGQQSLTRVVRISERINRETTPETPSHRTPGDPQRRNPHSSGRCSFSLCDMECSRSHATARDELNELNTIEYRLNCLMSQDRRRSLNPESSGKSFKVSFTLSNGSQQESHMVSLSKASALIAERKSYLEKKIDLESSHCQRVKQILTNTHNVSTTTSSPAVTPAGSVPVTPTGKPNVTLTSTPSFSKTRKPRALSLIESADGIVGLDSSSYANLMQDVKDVKTLLFRLQGLIHIVSFAFSVLIML